MEFIKKIKDINANLSLRSFTVFYRNFMVWLRYYKPGIIGDVLEPLLYLAALGFGVGKFIHRIDGISYVEYIVPGIIASSSMYAAAFESTFGAYTRMVTNGIYEAILLTPVGIEDIVLGEIFWGTAKAFMSGIAVLMVGIIFGWIISPLALFIPIIILLNGILFSSLSLLITSFSPSYDFFSYYFTIAISTMFLFSGVFYPVSSLPYFVKYFVYLMPLYYTVHIMRLLDGGKLHPVIFVYFVIIILFILLFFYSSVFFIRKRVIK
ncbi:MAG: ABC transporter permease [Deltaproteobacteria bacterium]|nr:ABC transporter permease [Deltaproteobacteria bacterium]MCL5879799.1 ABC transporter permease [Deltaproteobacteria bacterium]MDA8303918.1 ABC transporter permease [Deltaproteobacteria bacterium]